MFFWTFPNFFSSVLDPSPIFKSIIEEEKVQDMIKKFTCQLSLLCLPFYVLGFEKRIKDPPKSHKCSHHKEGQSCNKSYFLSHKV